MVCQRYPSRIVTSIPGWPPNTRGWEGHPRVWDNQAVVGESAAGESAVGESVVGQAAVGQAAVGYVVGAADPSARQLATVAERAF